MTTAQNNFVTKVRDSLIAFDKPVLNSDPLNIENNRVSIILRNGMAVMLFLAIEDFIKARTREILLDISNSTLMFSELPEKMQYSVTVDSVSAINRVFKQEETRYDKIVFIQNQAKTIASTLTPAFKLNEYSYGFKQSNINEDDVSGILKCFHVSNPWKGIDDITNRLGLSALPLKNSFKNGAKRRHSAAHDASSNVPINDLKQFAKDVLSIGLGFDSLITKAAKRIITKSVIIVNHNPVFRSSDVVLSRVVKGPRKWKFIKEGRTRSTKNESTQAQIDAFAIANASLSNEILILFDENGTVRGWENS